MLAMPPALLCVMLMLAMPPAWLCVMLCKFCDFGAGGRRA